MPGCLNWWIGAVFAVGASLFAFASLLILLPQLANFLTLSPKAINGIYFAGSIPFTTAAFLQLYQAAMADPLPGTDAEHHSTRPLVWRPGDIGWLSCALQFLGTLLFNVNTFDAMIPSISWWEQDFLVWIPNLIGSILFLSSGYLAFAEVCHAMWAWKPNSISWWVVTINLLGCLGFMASALLSFVTPGEGSSTALMLAVALTLQGAICFFIGAVLMMPETAIEQSEPSQGAVSA